MRIISISLLSLLLSNNLYSQTDSSAESFFPAAIGNSWHYQYTQTLGYITTITRDSVAKGSRFLFFDSSNVPAYEIDSMQNVWSDPTIGYRSLRYKLTAQRGEKWIAKDTSSEHMRTTRIIARVDSIFWDYIFGIMTQVKRIGYYYQPISDTTLFSAWRNDDYTASGFGLYQQITDAMQAAALWLKGCMINGKIYGDMTSVEIKSDNLKPSILILNPAFPNPFNPSTFINYQLPSLSVVSLKIYDVLGHEVAVLAEGIKEVGYYSVTFNGSGLSSGIYFARFTATPHDGTLPFTQTMKLLLTK